jgi:hypothetical protein
VSAVLYKKACMWLRFRSVRTQPRHSPLQLRVLMVSRGGTDTVARYLNHITTMTNNSAAGE